MEIQEANENTKCYLEKYLHKVVQAIIKEMLTLL